MRINALMLAAIVVTAGLGPPSAAHAARADKDCADFPSQRAAQLFFLNNNPAADPHRLDADGDGVVCESNGAPYYYGSDPTPGGDNTPAPPPKKVVTRIVKVLNGQLIKIREGKKAPAVVHLVGINVPKTGCEFKSAKQDLRSWVKPGMKVQVQTDKKAANRDPQGRLSRYLIRVNGNFDIGGSQVFRGYADVDRSIRFEDKTRYARWESKAVAQLKGYHATC